MSLFQLAHQQRRFIFGFVALAILVGLAAYGAMARQEDPSFPYRPGTIQAVYPGLAAQQVAKLIVEPLEEELLQVEEIDFFRSVIRDNVAIITLLLKDTIYDTDTAWDKVRRAMERAETQFPEGPISLDLNDRRMDIPAIVLSVVGTDDPLVLEDAADEIKKQLLATSGVSRIEVQGEPDRELVVEVDSTELNRLGINRNYIVGLLQARNQVVPGGLINVGEKFIRVNNFSDIQSLQELQLLPVPLPSGQQVLLGTIASIRMEPKMPAVAQVFHNGERAVQLGIYALRGQTDILSLGHRIRDNLEKIAPQYEPLQIKETFFQPDYVKSRLSNLERSLMISTLIIAAVVLLALGWRTGIMVALVLPVVAIITLAIYNMLGGILHQIAIIGVVVSLGILIDNAIVIVESIEANLRAGADRMTAASDAVKQLAMPLFSSTGTTIAAFIPLLLSKGNTADFTRAIPEMIVIALIISYLISIFVVPLVAVYWLREGRQRQVPGARPVARLALAVNSVHPLIPVVGVVLLLVATASLLPLVKQQFFPAASRNQIQVDLTFPAGTPVNYTAEKSLQLEQVLQARDDVNAVMRSVGSSGFRFYYNLSTLPSVSNFARLMVYTESPAVNADIIHWLDNEFQRQMPEATLVAKTLGQGPPIVAPIELRLHGFNKDELFSGAQQALAILDDIEGSRTVRSDLDTGLPELGLRFSDYTGQDLGVSRVELTQAIFSQTTGLASGEFRYDKDPVTIRVRSPEGENTPLAAIPSMYVYSDSSTVPLVSLAQLDTQWADAEIHHYDGRETVTIYSELTEGAASNLVLNEFFQRLAGNPLPPSVTLELGGEAAESDDANQAILSSAPLGIAVLLFFMMVQFNSFRRLAIIFTAIPLAAVGIIPGLILMDQPFGFQSLLGVIALIGIVVNNAIVLMDLVDAKLASGSSVLEAVQQAIEQRTAPILITTATTVLGLLPLIFSESSLWPPLASAIVSGLVMSTLLTLILVPSLIRLLVKPKSQQMESNAAVVSP